jgi:hypothetical protein
LVLADLAHVSHSGGMAETHDFTIKIEPDFVQPGRYRWNISEDRKVRDKSLYSFATIRDAQADADKFLKELNAIWGAR